MFNDYYAKYLGIDNGIVIDNCIICRSANRDIPINQRFIYKIIITDYDGKRYISVSPAISDDVINNICIDIKDKDFDDILKSQQLSKTGLRLSKMYRMILDEVKYPQCSLRSDIEIEYLSEFRKYIIRENDNIVSYCKVSNIDSGYGNIVVWTDENCRHNGFARGLLLKLLTMCKSEGIEPLYLVNRQNIASIQLAQSIGFKTAQTEIVACKEI